MRIVLPILALVLLAFPAISGVIPEKAADTARIQGTLVSTGGGAGWIGGSEFGKTTSEGGVSPAWFLFDIDTKTGKVVGGRAFLFGPCDMWSPLMADLREAEGRVSGDDWEVVIKGRASGVEGAETVEFPAVLAIRGSGLGKEVSGRYVFNAGRRLQPANWRNPDDNLDHGGIVADVLR